VRVVAQSVAKASRRNIFITNLRFSI
jgi:hypothetical protein